MGCGGSRADAIEPRYYESWTRETESTWLTYTDSDAPPSNAAPDSGPEAGGLHAVLSAQQSDYRHETDSPSQENLFYASLLAPGSLLAVFRHGVLEDGVSSNGVSRSTAPNGISNPEKKMSCGTQCPNPQSLSSGPLTQKQNGLQTAEAKRDAKRTSAKEVTINVADSIRQVDRSRRITKNCIN
ncbi:brain and acute leukemia cytoplasmic protein isoform X1 [Hippopotamus amphibius kiboko]|uniref:brain and acute leukemia cytoplasmic protein isoform X1 n=1 Tax=Hippopotamus amphibius kiboko TaxID=575201 RepID=UPI00259568B7|nr:brain and acute leukemia cytoplasmic protein isoform X1 [Hippopotamus amphibius kiboko]